MYVSQIRSRDKSATFFRCQSRHQNWVSVNGKPLVLPLFWSFESQAITDTEIKFVQLWEGYRSPKKLGEEGYNLDPESLQMYMT